MARERGVHTTTHCISRTNTLDRGVEWTWDKSLSNDYIDLVNDDRDVKFHRNFSSGTAVVRGSKPLLTDQYFWEIEMISPVYGTDMMIGIGTPEADVSQVHDRFISYLGMNNHTWGLSYTGLFHHNGELKSYSPRFGQGCIIGVHLDMWNGTLSYYKNKKHLGIATRGLKGKTLYAMASSTAACSAMRIVSSCSFPSSLQFLCCAKLRELIPDEKNVLKELTLPPGLQIFLENNLSWLLDRRHNVSSLPHHSLAPRLNRWGYDYSFNRTVNRLFEDHTVFGQETSEEMDFHNSRGIKTFYVVSNRPCILCDCNRFQRSLGDINMSSQSHRNCVAGHEESVDKPSNCTNKPGTSMEAQEASSNKPDKATEASTSCKDNENSEDDDGVKRLHYLMGLSDPDSEDNENSNDDKAKRLRLDVNYLMGLSDPDSE